MKTYELLRVSTGSKSTIGVLYDVMFRNAVAQKQKNMLSFTLEDTHRNIKVYGQTRIPTGVYPLRLREYGSFHDKYKEKFDWHEGMIEICDVPDFSDVLIHIGNDDDDTEGCLLVANTASQNLTESGFVGQSTDAYKRVYLNILKALKTGEDVRLKIVDYEFI